MGWSCGGGIGCSGEGAAGASLSICENGGARSECGYSLRACAESRRRKEIEVWRSYCGGCFGVCSRRLTHRFRRQLRRSPPSYAQARCAHCIRRRHCKNLKTVCWMKVVNVQRPSNACHHEKHGNQSRPLSVPAREFGAHTSPAKPPPLSYDEATDTSPTWNARRASIHFGA